LEPLGPTRAFLVGDHASTTGDDMLEATAVSLRERGPHRPRGSGPRRARSLPTAWESGGVHPVDIVVHDQDSARILLEYAVPLFAAEMVPGPVWAIRLQPPAGEGWIVGLLALIERWLESARLPCAKVLCGGRSYLIRTSPDIFRLSTVTDITGTPMPASVPRA
jgi:hypothetical protein